VDILMSEVKKAEPIFIIGVARSGTTLLSLILDSHSRIAIPYESHFFIKYFKKKESFGNLKHHEKRLKLIKNILAEPYVSKWDKKIKIDDISIEKCINLEETIEQIYLAYAFKCGKDIWGDKTPEYIKDIHILNKMFPFCKFIHIIRDGRDVALSIKNKWWGANDFMSAIRYWADNVSCARKMLSMLSDERYTELKFEDLILNPENEIRRITNFLEINFEKKMIKDFAKKATDKLGSKAEKHHENLRKGILLSQAYKWKKKLLSVDQAIAFEIAGPILAELGYPMGAKAHPLKLLRKGFHKFKETYEWRFNK
jgi:hypothetical protein